MKKLFEKSIRDTKITKNKEDSLMKSFRKALSLIVAVAMTLTLMIPVFAATPTDVVGTSYEDSVGKLVTLGIIKGYEDGSFKPDQNITRAEFSKIACYLIGVQAAADLAKGSTKFSDVKADHWASGYINVAAEKGMLKGYPDKSFKPEANVTYAEAITILVRAIGMGDFVEKQGGTWPANYLEKAASAGITKDVTGFSGNTAAIRGVIGQLSWNALEAEKWGAKEYTSTGITYGPIGKTLLQEQYSDYVYKNSDDQYVTKSFKDVKVIGTQAGGALNADQIKIETESHSDLADMLDVTAGDDVTVDVTATGVNLSSLYGLKVDLLFGKDNKVANIKISSSTSDVVTGYIDDYITAEQKIEVKATKDATETKKYGFTSDAVVFVDTQAVADLDTFFDTVAPELENSTAKITAILKSGSIETLKITSCDELSTVAGITDMKQFVVKEITSKNEVKNVAENSETIFDLDDLSDADAYIITKNGAPAGKEDIKAGNAVTYVERANITYIIVSDATVTGKITKNSSDDNAANAESRRTLTIDGKSYEMAFDGSAAMSKKNSTDEEDVVDAIDDMSDFYGKDATLTLNALGDIVFVNGSITASSANMQVGVVSRAATVSGEDYNIKILGQDGIAKSYTLKSGDIRVAGSGDLESDANYTEEDLDAYVDATGIEAGEPVMFEVSADNKINAEDFYVLNPSNNVFYGDLYINAVDGTITKIVDSTKKITADGDIYLAKSSTTFLNADTDNLEMVENWDSVVSDDYAGAGDDANSILDESDPLLFVCDEDNVLKSVILSADDATYLSSDDIYGIYVDDETNNDDTLINLLVDGVAKQYTVAGDIYDDVAVEKGDLMIFSLSDGEYSDDTMAINVSTIQDFVDEDAADADYYNIDNWDSTDKIITFDTACVRASGDSEDIVTLADDVVVYDCTGTTPVLGSLSDIDAGAYVTVEDYDADDDTYGIVVIVD